MPDDDSKPRRTGWAILFVPTLIVIDILGMAASSAGRYSTLAVAVFVSSRRSSSSPSFARRAHSVYSWVCGSAQKWLVLRAASCLMSYGVAGSARSSRPSTTNEVSVRRTPPTTAHSSLG